MMVIVKVTERINPPTLKVAFRVCMSEIGLIKA